MVIPKKKKVFQTIFFNFFFMFLDNVFFKNYNENDVAVLACEIIMIGLYNPNYARSGPDHARRFIGSQYNCDRWDYM